MNTDQILNHLKLICKNKAQYAVLASDQLRTFKIKKFPVCLVINTDPSYKKGTHWISIFKKSKHCDVEVFDSYGLGLDFWSDDLKQIQKQNCIFQNKVPLQSLNSNVCGKYALYFLYKRMKGCKPWTIYSRFSNDRKKNDSKVDTFIKSKQYLFNSKCSFKTKIQVCKSFKLAIK